MTLKDLKKLVQVASEQKGGWESYRAREKALAELLHYMPRLIAVADAAKDLELFRNDGLNGNWVADELAAERLLEALTALEGK